jgi:hypothetical protein
MNRKELLKEYKEIDNPPLSPFRKVGGRIKRGAEKTERR